MRDTASVSQESTEVARPRPKRQIYYLCGNFPNQYLSLTRKLSISLGPTFCILKSRKIDLSILKIYFDL